MKGSDQWKWQSRKWVTNSIIFSLTTNWHRCWKNCFEAKTYKLEALSLCRLEFLLLDFWSLPCSSGFAIRVILWEVYVQRKKKFCSTSLGCLLGIFSPVLKILSRNVPSCLKNVWQLWGHDWREQLSLTYSCIHMQCVKATRVASQEEIHCVQGRQNH